MFETLVHWDTELFAVINGAHNSFFDSFFYAVSWKHTWLLYLPVLYLIYRKKGLAFALSVLLGMLMVFVFADLIAARILKPGIGRLRPCHTPELETIIHLVKDKCGGQFSFVSNHAANHFGLATFVSAILCNIWKKWAWIPLVFATLVAYSRVYLGVHFPGDVICGGALGWGIAKVIFKIWGKFIFHKLGSQ